MQSCSNEFSFKKHSFFQKWNSIQNLKDFKSRNVQNANERRPLTLRPIEALIDSVDKPFEHSLVAGFRNRFDGVLNLLFVLRLVHVFSPNFDPWTQQRFGQLNHWQPEQMT